MEPVNKKPKLTLPLDDQPPKSGDKPSKISFIVFIPHQPTNDEHKDVPTDKDATDKDGNTKDGDDSDADDADDSDYIDENEAELDNESECDKSDCDHQDLGDPDDLNDDNVKKTRLESIKKINDIKDLIQMGDLYHCRRRTHYMGVDLKILHKLRKPLRKLNNMIRLTNIKENIVDQIIYFLSGLQSTQEDMLHTIIEGPPGCGKTEVGRILGEIYMTVGDP